ncbi:transketolase [Streptomyces sp900105245]|uniref:Transketolase n=1 Tax=Streptomyces sp. 900105245 TaxID=3154379 RepID=A0ABV1UJB8_9ACTN
MTELHRQATSRHCPPDALALRARRARRRLLQYAAFTPIHVGSSLSVTDILTVLYGGINLVAVRHAFPGRDRVILSKGHAVWALYAVLAEVGLMRFPQAGVMPGHPAEGTTGVDAGTGALGHGLSIGAGLAEAARLSRSDQRTFVVLGDGELNEGSVWEAAMFAAHRRLSSLTAIVDVNGMQQEGATHSVLDMAPLDHKWRAFGWDVRTVNGHDTAALQRTLFGAQDSHDRPSVVLAHTVKGKGVPFMENSAQWHYGTVSPEQLSVALEALGSEPGDAQPVSAQEEQAC